MSSKSFLGSDLKFLIKFFFQNLTNESTDRRMIEKLSTLMDPKNDNAYLTVDEFVAVGKKWMNYVKESRNEETENRRVVYGLKH